MGTDRHTDRQTTNDFLGLLSEPKIMYFLIHNYCKVLTPGSRAAAQATVPPPWWQSTRPSPRGTPTTTLPQTSLRYDPDLWFDTFSQFCSTLELLWICNWRSLLYSNLIPHQDLHHCRHLPWLLTLCRRHHRHLRRPTHQVRQKLAEKIEIWTKTWIEKLK